MSIIKIQAALEKKLATLTPKLATAYENTAFSPVTGTPYQRVNLLVNRPVDHAFTLDVTEERGIFQVTLMYPPGTGRGEAQARAEAIRALFKPPQILAEGGVKITLTSTVQIGSGAPSGERWMVPLSIYWRSFG